MHAYPISMHSKLRKKEKEKKMGKQEANSAHVLVIPFPSQGHINPMLQFSRRLVSKGVKATLVITNYLSNTLNPKPDGHVRLVTMSDGYDQGGFSEAEDISTYLTRFESVGSRSIRDIIVDHVGTPYPITCLVYDSILPWALDVAKKYGLVGASFFTQASTVNYIYYLVKNKKLDMPVGFGPMCAMGLPLLKPSDLPSFVGSSEAYPAYLELVLNQYSNLEKVDFVLVNTYYELEHEVVDAMSKEYPLLTIGPTIPSIYLDNRIAYDKDYGLNLYNLDSNPITNWLNTKPNNSVIYVSFGSMANLSKEQIEELAWGLMGSNHYFLWVVRASEEGKLPKNFGNETIDKGLIVKWCTQLEVLANDAIGCFLTHCGWNSTLEALVLGVPMITMPQWTDQPLNSKLVEDVWKVGVRVKLPGDTGLVKREVIASCILEVMVGKKKNEFKESGNRWKDLARKAVSQGGSSDRNINSFIAKISSLK